MVKKQVREAQGPAGARGLGTDKGTWGCTLGLLLLAPRSVFSSSPYTSLLGQVERNRTDITILSFPWSM